MSNTPTRTVSSTSARGGRRRPSEFLLPDGKKVLVALPEEAAALRHKYASISSGSRGAAGAGRSASPRPGRERSGDDNGEAAYVSETITDDGKHAKDGDAAVISDEKLGGSGSGSSSTNNDRGHGLDVEVVVHGSPEHHVFLQQSLAHHEQRREELRARHGPAFEEWEAVAAQLENVSTQIEHMADHSATLRANFSKFGYDARLRTYSDEDGGGSERSASPGTTLSARSSQVDLSRTGSAAGEVDWNERRGGETMKLFKKPVVKQYFHRGLLWRAREETEVQSFELFFDLLYVGIIAINGDHAAEDANGHELLRFVITFCMSWKIWSDVAQFVSWFDTNDVMQRVEILFLIACLLGLTTNMLQTFSETSDTYVQLVGYYLAARLFTAAYCVLTGILLPIIKGMMISQIVVILVSSAIWIVSTQQEMPIRLAAIFVALFIDLFGGHIITVTLFRYGRDHTGRIASKIAKFYEFYPAVNIEHKVERTNAFVTLVLGYSVVGVIYQNAGFGVNAFLGKAVLGLVQAFVFNWLYFEVDGSNVHVHAIRRHVLSATLWQYSHLVFIMSFILAAAALSRIVLVTDCPDAPVDTLTDAFIERSATDISMGLRYYYCLGLGLSLAAMGMVSISHHHKLPPTCRLPKSVRLANRFVVSIILFCLSAAQNLTSLNLVSITTALIVWVLLVEIFGKSQPEEAFYGGRCPGYTARCTKRQLQEMQRDEDGEIRGRQNSVVPDVN